MDKRRLRQLAEELRCSVCLEFYKMPRVLACQHSFCTECLEHLYRSERNGRELRCPICRKPTPLEDGAESPVERLTMNIPLHNIVTQLSSNYTSRSPSPDQDGTLVPAFPPGACGVDYSFSALPPRTPSPIVLLERALQSPDNCHAAPIDFPISKVEAQIFNWAEKLWFAPTNFLREVKRQAPFDIYVEYLPFYILEFSAASSCTAQVCDLDIDRIERYQRTSSDISLKTEETISSSSERDYCHLICAAKEDRMYELSQNITDWNPYAAIPTFHINSNCSCYSWSTVWHVRGVEEVISKKEEAYMSSQIKKQYSLHSLDLTVEFSEVFHTLIYLPVYITHYEYRSETYAAMVSAQTGSVSAERPFGLGGAGQMIDRIRKWFHYG